MFHACSGFRILAAGLTLILTFSAPLPASPLPPLPAPAFFPPAIASIESSFRGNSGKKIFFIQDAHDSLEAQENIASLIDHLVEEEGVSLVMEEGYEGPLNTDFVFSRFSDPGKRQKLSHFLLDQLQLSAAEYAHINRKKDFRLTGVDSMRLYRKTLAAYAEAGRFQTEIDRELEWLEKYLDRSANQKLPSSVRKWLKLSRRFEDGTLDPAAYMQRLRRIAGEPDERLDVLSRTLEILDGRETDGHPFDASETPKLFDQLRRYETLFLEQNLDDPETLKLALWLRTIPAIHRLAALRTPYGEFKRTIATMKYLSTGEIADWLSAREKRPILLARRWEKLIQEAASFYELAAARETALAEKLDLFLKKRTDTQAVLVYGGFHKEAILEILREKQISYDLILPTISHPDPVHEERYRRLMAGNTAGASRLVQDQAAPTEHLFARLQSGAWTLSQVDPALNAVSRLLNRPEGVVTPRIMEETWYQVLTASEPVKTRSEMRTIAELEIVRLIEELNAHGVKPRVHGTDLMLFGDRTDALMHFIQRYSIIKDPHDIRRILLWRLNIEKQGHAGIPLSGLDPETVLLLYEGIFDQEQYLRHAYSRDALDILIFRRAYGGRELTHLLNALPNVYLKLIVSATDDGHSWFHGAREFGAPGIPGAGKALVDLGRDRLVKEFLESRLGAGEKPAVELEQDFRSLAVKLTNPQAGPPLSESMFSLHQKAMRLDVDKRILLAGYISDFIHTLDQHRNDHPDSQFTFENIPIRSIVLMGAVFRIRRDHPQLDPWQQAVEEIGAILEIEPGNEVILPTHSRYHLVALREDGTVYFSETAINEHPSAIPFVGLWLIGETVDESYIEAFEEELRADHIHLTQIDPGEIPEVLEARSQILATTRRVEVSQIRELATRMAKRSRNSSLAARSAGLSSQALQAVQHADMILYTNDVLAETSVAGALIVPGMREAIEANKAAVKISLAEGTSNGSGTNIFLNYLDNVNRYLSGKTRYWQIEAPWEEIGAHADFLLAGLVGDQDLSSIEGHLSEIEETTQHQVGTASVSSHAIEQYGFYSSAVLGEALIALNAIKKANLHLSQEAGLTLPPEAPTLEPIEMMRLGLFRDEQPVQQLIREIKVNWSRIIQEGAFVFDVDLTILPKNAESLNDYQELAYLFMRLLREGVRVAIISGNSYEEQGARIFEAIRQEMRDNPRDIRNLTFYVSGGGTKFRFDSRGRRRPDLAYNVSHAMDLGNLEAAINETLLLQAQDRFGLTKELITPYIAEAAKKNKGLTVTAPWAAGPPEAWPQPEWVTPDEVKKRKAEGKSISIPWVEKRGEFTDASGQNHVASITIKPTPRFTFGGDIIDIRPRLQEALRNRLGIEAAAALGIRSGGSTSTDITSNLANKTSALLDFISTNHLTAKWVYYLGDEFFEVGSQIGNDEVIARDPALAEVRTLGVNSDTSEGAASKTLWIGRTPQATLEFLEEILIHSSELKILDMRKRSELRQETRLPLPPHLQALKLEQDVVYIIRNSTLESLPDAEDPGYSLWREFLGLKMLNEKKLHVVILQDNPATPGGRAWQLKQQFSSVHLDWSSQIPENAVAIQFEPQPKDEGAEVPARSADIHTDAVFELFEGSFMTALLFALDNRKEDLFNTPVIGNASAQALALLESFFETFVLVSRSA